METNLTRQQLFSLFKSDAHAQLEKAISVYPHGLTVWENRQGQRRATGSSLDAPEGFVLVGTYKEIPDMPPVITGSRTQSALRYLSDHPNVSILQTARLFDISPQAIHMARARRKNRTDVCPCCKQVIRVGFKVQS